MSGRAMCCGTWRIDVVRLDATDWYRLTRDGMLIDRTEAYVARVADLVAVLARYGGPSLDQFEDC